MKNTVLTAVIAGVIAIAPATVLAEKADTPACDCWYAGYADSAETMGSSGNPSTASTDCEKKSLGASYSEGYNAGLSKAELKCPL